MARSLLTVLSCTELSSLCGRLAMLPLGSDIGSFLAVGICGLAASVVGQIVWWSTTSLATQAWTALAVWVSPPVAVW